MATLYAGIQNNEPPLQVLKKPHLSTKLGGDKYCWLIVDHLHKRVTNKILRSLSVILKYYRHVLHKRYKGQGLYKTGIRLPQCLND